MPKIFKHSIYLTYSGKSIKARALLLKEVPRKICRVEINGVKFEGQLPMTIQKHIKETLRINVHRFEPKRKIDVTVPTRGTTRIDGIKVKCRTIKLGKGEEDIRIKIQGDDSDILQKQLEKITEYMLKHTNLLAKDCYWDRTIGIKINEKNEA